MLRSQNADLVNAMLLVSHCRNLCAQMGLELVCVQVTPAAFAGVVSRTGPAALETAGLPRAQDEHAELSGREVEREVDHGSGRGDSKDLRVEVDVSHQ